MNQLLRFLVPLLLVQGTSVHAVEFPAFTWDKVPVYQMFADNQRLLTEAEVAEISSTSGFICIEKQHGLNTLGGAELGTKHEIPRFKALNPNTKCLFYFNSAYAYPFTSYTKDFSYGKVSGKHEQFLLKDPETSELAHRGNTYYFDVLDPEFRSWWAETVGKGVTDSGADGLFVDQMHGFSWLRPTKITEVEKAQAEMMRMAKQAIGSDKILLLNNGAHIPELFEIGDAFMFEHYSPTLLTKEAILNDWELMGKISHAGKIAVWRIGVEQENPDIATTDGNPQSRDAAYEALSKERVGFYLAAFLIGAQPNCYFQYGWGWELRTGPLADYPEFKKPLGKPLGDFTRPEPGGRIFKREFEHASVWLNLDTREGKIDWK
jgi:hypothetical protein